MERRNTIFPEKHMSGDIYEQFLGERIGRAPILWVGTRAKELGQF